MLRKLNYTLKSVNGEEIDFTPDLQEQWYDYLIKKVFNDAISLTTKRKGDFEFKNISCLWNTSRKKYK